MLLILFFIVISSLIIGSALNVVIDHLPVVLSRKWDNSTATEAHEKPSTLTLLKIFSPRKHCHHCYREFSLIENIPIIGFLLQKGRCQNCHTKIPLRHSLIELLTMITLLLALSEFGISNQAWCAMLLSCGLIMLAAIDIDAQLLPDQLTLPLLWLGLLASLFTVFVTPTQAIMGAIAGYCLLWLVATLYQLITGRVGMGNGDFKLLAALGAWVGWQQLLIILLLSSLLGSVIGLSLMVFKKWDVRTPLPFGPFLAIAGWISLMWGPAIWQTSWQRLV